MKGILELYEDYLKRKDKEESTIKMYIQIVNHFIIWLESKQKRLERLTRNDVIEYREHLLEKGIKISTINKRISTLRTFLVWATQNSFVQMNTPENFRLHEYKNNHVKWLTTDEESMLLNLVSYEKNPFKKARNEALIFAFLYTGLRIEEVAQLRTEEITEKTIQVFHDGSLSREIPLSHKVADKLNTWIHVRKHVYPDSPFLFVTERSGRMQPRSIQFVIEVYSEKLGFTITSQILRNTYCRRLVERGHTVEQVKQYAGHKTIATSYKFFRN